MWKYICVTSNRPLLQYTCGANVVIWCVDIIYYTNYLTRVSINHKSPVPIDYSKP